MLLEYINILEVTAKKILAAILPSLQETVRKGTQFAINNYSWEDNEYKSNEGRQNDENQKKHTSQ